MSIVDTDDGLRHRSVMAGDLTLDLADASESLVPSHLQFRRHQPVLGIGRVILPECPVGGVASRLQIALEGVADLIAAIGLLRFGLGGSGNGSRLDDPEKCLLDGVVDAQAAEGDAAWLAIVEQAAPAGIARNVMLVPVYRTVSLRPQRLQRNRPASRASPCFGAP